MRAPRPSARSCAWYPSVRQDASTAELKRFVAAHLAEQKALKDKAKAHKALKALNAEAFKAHRAEQKAHQAEAFKAHMAEQKAHQAEAGKAAKLYGKCIELPSGVRATVAD